MRILRFAALAALVAVVALLCSARAARQVTGLDLARFPGREVLAIRTGGGVAAPTALSRDAKAGKLSFLLKNAGADGVQAPAQGLSLIRRVELDNSDPQGAQMSVWLAQPELADQKHYRVSQPSDNLILLEVFPGADDKQDAKPLTGGEDELRIPGGNGAGVPASQPATGAAARATTAPASSFDAALHGVTTVDLRGADPQRVLGLAAATGLIKMTGPSYVATEGLGEMSVKPAAQGLASWSKTTPPGELYLSGSADQIADFLRRADPKLLSGQPTLEQVWEANRPHRGGKPLAFGGRQVGGYPKYQGDPYNGLYVTDSLPGGSRLSDIRVTLPATGGMNLYDVLNYLSEISGISLIIDPYAMDDPTGSRRDPLPPDEPQNGTAQPGFRPGTIFDPQFSGGSGTVMGNLDNVPFDQALQLILETHELQYVVYGGTEDYAASSGSGSSGGADSGDYEKPVILVTSRERLNQELAGQSQINLYQFQYADPQQMTNILDNFNLLPGTNTGWYVYQGSGNGNGSGNGGGGQFGGGRGGGSGNGGGSNGGGGVGSGGRSPNLYTAKSGLLVYRGSNRDPVLRKVIAALDGGAPVIRVLLAGETSGQYVTALSLP